MLCRRALIELLILLLTCSSESLKKTLPESMINASFGEKVKTLREQLGYSLNDLSILSGVSASYINRIEQGERKQPSYKIIEAISSGLQVNPSHFIQVAFEGESSLLNDLKETKMLSLEDLLRLQTYTIYGEPIKNDTKDILIKIIDKLHQRWEMTDSAEFIQLAVEYQQHLQKNYKTNKKNKRTAKIK